MLCFCGYICVLLDTHGIFVHIIGVLSQPLRQPCCQENNQTGQKTQFTAHRMRYAVKFFSRKLGHGS